MSGEKRLKLVGFLALTLICLVLVIASGASAEEGDESTELLDDLNENQNVNGSWDDDYNTTIVARAANDAALDRYGDFCSIQDCASNEVYRCAEIMSVADESDEWIVDFHSSGGSHSGNSYSGNPGETITFTLKITNFGSSSDSFIPLQIKAKDELLVSQQFDGSWNNDTGDTALATWALAPDGDNSEAVEKGVKWLQDQEDIAEHSWGSVQNDSKAILALDSAGEDVWQEIAALMLKQKPDGSFGGIEDTSWAVIALSTNPNKETMESMDRAVQWLRSQDYDNNYDLAIAALAEQKYENAKLMEERGKGGGSGFIPPPWLYALSIFIICSLVMGYWLFARLDRNGTLDGIRKDIYAYIAEHPGEHLANITKTLDLSSSSARYHLSVLEGMDKVVSHKNGKFKRYYINKNGYSKYTNGNGYKGIMSALKNNTARKIVKFLISNPESNQKCVSNALKIHPSTVNWHAQRLKDAEIINKNRKGKEIVYSLNQDVQLSKVIGILEGSPA